MSLPAARFALSHVGSAGDQGPDPAACADPKVRGLLRRRQFEQRPIRTHDVPDVQRRDFPELPQATAAPASLSAWEKYYRRIAADPDQPRPTGGRTGNPVRFLPIGDP